MSRVTVASLTAQLAAMTAERDALSEHLTAAAAICTERDALSTRLAAAITAYRALRDSTRHTVRVTTWVKGRRPATTVTPGVTS